MKVLLCHNFYKEPGGEDRSFAAEAQLLETSGHEVVRYTVHNDRIDTMSRCSVALRTYWNPQTYWQLRYLIRRERPALLHCTNIFPLISPAAYDAARAEGIPVVQSLRNYRLFCANSFFFRNGRVCEDCMGKRFAWPAIVHRCYRKSRAGTAVVASAMAIQRKWRRQRRGADVYFTLTEFSRHKLIEGGLPPAKIVVKPNFVDPDPGPGAGGGRYAVFVGRLSSEKGLTVLLEAWKQLEGALALKIIGDGPLCDMVQAAANGSPDIQWLGRQGSKQVLSIVGNASCLVMPSLWYETFGRTMIEAYSRGTPVVASRLGAMAELIEEGRTGLHFMPGDANDLAAKIRQLLQSPRQLQSMRQNARQRYLEKYTAEVNLRLLTAIYHKALGARCAADTDALVGSEP